MKPKYTYSAFVDNVVDGDTIDVSLDLGFGIYWKTRVRLNGIDTPELNSADPVLRESAQAAKTLVSIAILGKKVTLVTYKPDKFGRYLVDVYWGTEHKNCLNQQLIEDGVAKPYFGGKKE